MSVFSKTSKDIIKILSFLLFSIISVFSIDYLFSFSNIAENIGWNSNDIGLTIKEITNLSFSVILPIIAIPYAWFLYKNYKMILYSYGDDDYSHNRLSLVSFPNIVVFIIGCLMAFAAFLSSSAQQVSSIAFLFNSPVKIVLSIIGIVSISLFAFSIVKYLFIKLQKYRKYFFLLSRNNNWELQHYIIVAIILVICWLPYIIYLNPGTVYWDAIYQLGENTQFIDLDTHHPVLSTYIMNILYSMGQILGNDNLGILFIVIVQTIAFSCAYTFVIYILNQIRTPKIIVYLSIIFFALYPVFGISAQIVMKDALFSAIFVVFISLFIKFILDIYYLRDNDQHFEKQNMKTKETKAEDDTAQDLAFPLQPLFSLKDNRNYNLLDNFRLLVKPLLIIAIFSIISALLRKNALIIVILSLFALICIFPKKRFKAYIGIYALSCSLCMISLFALFNMISGASGNLLGDIRETLSLPVQQSARYMLYADEGTEEWEEKAINDFLDNNDLSDYRTWIADGVKDTISSTSYDDKFFNYLKAYISQGFKSPITYLDAFVLLTDRWWCFSNTSIADYGEEYQNHVLISNNIINGTAAKNILRQFSDELISTNDVEYFNWYNVSSETNQSNIHFFAEHILYDFPVIGLFMQPALYFWLIILCIGWILYRREYKYLIILLPGSLLMLSAILGPVNGLIRYILPLYSTIIIMMIACYQGDIKGLADISEYKKGTNS